VLIPVNTEEYVTLWGLRYLRREIREVEEALEIQEKLKTEGERAHNTLALHDASTLTPRLDQAAKRAEQLSEMALKMAAVSGYSSSKGAGPAYLAAAARALREEPRRARASMGSTLRGAKTAGERRRDGRAPPRHLRKKLVRKPHSALGTSGGSGASARIINQVPYLPKNSIEKAAGHLLDQDRRFGGLYTRAHRRKPS
jgi:hypothetical protein